MKQEIWDKQSFATGLWISSNKPFNVSESVCTLSISGVFIYTV